MSTVRLRPTFRTPLTTDREAAIEEIRRRLTEDERFAGRWRGKGRWAEIYVDHRERRLWSPHLSLRLDRDDDGGCTLFGRFAPHPEVWTFFMFLYIGLAFAAVFGSVLGYVQWVSGEAAWGLWVAVVGLPAIGLIHVAGAVGQRLGQEQMRALKEEIDVVLEGLVAAEVEEE
jgi:hypothetical protein